MSVRRSLQMTIVGLLVLVCIAFVAVAGATAAPAAASPQAYDTTDDSRTANDRSTADRNGVWSPDDRRRDAGRTRVNVRTVSDAIVVTNDGDVPVDVAVDASRAGYPVAGQHRLQPGEAMQLPVPQESAMVRVTARSEDARLVAQVRFEAYRVDCGPASRRTVAPTAIAYEWETATGRSGGRSQQLDPPTIECPDAGNGSTVPLPTPPDDGNGSSPPPSPEEGYEDAREQFWSSYEDGNATFWGTYEFLRALAFGQYEDARSAFWSAYEEFQGGDGADPGERVNRTIGDVQSVAERVGDDATDDADRVREDGEYAVGRISEDAQGDAERVREDVEGDLDRIQNDTGGVPGGELPGGDGNGTEDLPSRDDLPDHDDLPNPGGPPSVPDLPDQDDLPDHDDLPNPGGPPSVPDLPDHDDLPGDGGSEPPSLPGGGESVSADADGDVHREENSIVASGSAEATVEAGVASVHVDEDVESEIGLTP